MDLISLVLSALLFAAFVPGVLVTLPKGESKMIVLGVHGVLFAVVAHFVMHYYWRYVREQYGNYGPTCPNGYVMTADKSCVPAGHATADPSAKLL